MVMDGRYFGAMAASKVDRVLKRYSEEEVKAHA
jgi:hypothetical protein